MKTNTALAENSMKKKKKRCEVNKILCSANGSFSLALNIFFFFFSFDKIILPTRARKGEKYRRNEKFVFFQIY